MPAKAPQPDAIRVLKDDHRTVEKLFREFEKAGDRAVKTKQKLAARIIEELSVHAAIEELVFYPAVRSCSDEIKRDVLEALEEHHVAKWLLSEIDDLGPEDERFDAKVTVLIESVRHHVKEEETTLFPLVRSAMEPAALREMGAQLMAAKLTAPTLPHPRMPDTPPGNIAALPLGVVDRVRSRVRAVAR